MDPEPDNPDFADLGLCDEILEALDAAGYREPTPIQAGAIPPLLEGRDFLGVAQTGTGKTAAFALPILQRLHDDPRQLRPKAPRVLVLAPTRELASQIAVSFDTYGRDLDIRSTRVFGGVGKSPQISALRQGVDVVVATPGRLLDLMGDRHIDIRHVEVFVLDEADRMLDMGFIHDVKRVIGALPKRRQTLLLSATMPEDIVSLSSRILHDPVRVEVTPPASTVELILQLVYFVERPDKRALLSHILEDRSIERVLVFSRTKHGANRIARYLQKWQVTAAAIHGDKGQGARERALEQFRAGEVRVLVATDIAARGIDVKGVTHVINFDLPNVPEHYVHRIGRTARAGRSGVAISFCDVTEREYLKDIETLTREPIEVVDDHPYRSTVPMGRRATQRAAEDAKRESRRRGGGGRGGRSGGGRSGGGRSRGRGRGR